MDQTTEYLKTLIGDGDAYLAVCVSRTQPNYKTLMKWIHDYTPSANIVSYTVSKTNKPYIILFHNKNEAALYKMRWKE